MEGGLFDTPFEKAFKEWKKAHKKAQGANSIPGFMGEDLNTTKERKAFLDKVVATENNPSKNKKSEKNCLLLNHL